MCPRRTLNLAPDSGCNASDVIGLDSRRTVFPYASKKKVIFPPKSMEEQVFLFIFYLINFYGDIPSITARCHHL